MGDMKGDPWSLDYSSYELLSLPALPRAPLEWPKGGIRGVILGSC